MGLISLLFLLLLSKTSIANPDRRGCNQKENEDHPILCSAIGALLKDPAGVSRTLHQFAKASQQLVQPLSRSSNTTIAKISRRSLRKSEIPVVFAHGMGDSCFNDGMKSITEQVGQMLNTYSTCIPTGKNQAEDTSNGYFLNMDASVDVFAASVRNDPKLSKGFHAIGFSQGNNVIRGYIARYNDPTVHTLSLIHI